MEKLKEGDVLLINSGFKLGVFTTYLIPFIHLFQNIQTLWGLLKPFYWYHHSAIVVEKDGKLCLFEALLRNEYTDIEKIKDYNSYKVLRINDNIKFSKEKLREEADRLNGRPYDFVGVLLVQSVKLLTFGKITIKRGKRDNIRQYCSKLTQHLINVATGIDLFTSFDDAPIDIWGYCERRIYTLVETVHNKK